MMMLVYTFGAATLIVLIWLSMGIGRIGAVSDGAQIENRTGSALLLIDLQDVFWERGPYSTLSKSQAEAVILEEVSAAKTNEVPVIAIRQEWSIPATKVIARLTMRGHAVEGTPGTELAKPFDGLADHVLVKRVQDGFETGELDALLSKLEVGKLRLLGLDFNYCVQKTALAARNRGYEVNVVENGTLSAAPTEQAAKHMRERGVVVQ